MSEKIVNDGLEKSYSKHDEIIRSRYEEIWAACEEIFRSEMSGLESTGGIMGIKAWLEKGLQQDKE
ncbi:MAG: hypothetical protein DRG37_08245 [Deltaproteobacteria bacterium]|nr:MAG: hypothetical protein DRG37_08245 [Deltaproteobacteria bacterium]